MVCFYVLAVLPGLITAAIANQCPSVGNLRFFELKITEFPEILVDSKCHDKQYRNLAKKVLREYTARGQLREGALMKIAKAYKTSDTRKEALEHLQQQLNEAKFEVNKSFQF
ncbi:unnamed protein product [Cylicocyclus nassatus]|uniref:Uncharacterized protein n=1 Tax=Cylicocyclus nassatus TaxID=53992 RepID=A0AA36GJL2_CYLNA|nr:unnamed protein product [Cylicocyclus nassatus]